MRVFLAIDIPEEIKKEIYQIYEDENINGIKFVEKENLHITLRFFGEKNQFQIDKIKEKMNQINFEKFNIELKDIGFFPNENYIRVIWIGINSEKIYELNKILNKLFGKDEKFHPHLTIGRVKFINKDVLKFIEQIKKLKINYNFEVEKIILKKSTLTNQGPIYENLYEVKLNG